MPEVFPAEAAEFAQYNTAVHPQAAVALAAAWDWAEGVRQGEQRGLVLWGRNYGSGKTHLARSADYWLARNGRLGNFYAAPQWFGRIKSLYDKGGDEQQLFADWARRDPFILDDLGKQYATSSGSDWAREKLFRLLDGLYSAGRSILVTCNLNPEELAEMLGGASFSRLAGLAGRSGFVDMSAIPDYRLKP